MNVVLIVAIGWACHLVSAQEKTCSGFCSSLGMLQSNPGKSCDDIYQINKASRGASRDYWINTTTGVHQVYCDMELECGGHKGGWMRIADHDTSRGDDCPSGWIKDTTNDPGQASVDACRSDINAGCYSALFNVNGVSYHRICGKARGYQKHTTDAFGGDSRSKSINDAYVDGVSITLGNPRKHVWSYAIGYSDDVPSLGNCPCAASPGTAPFAFINNDYYCESGSIGQPSDIFYTNDPLWDGSGCIAANNNCCANVNMPWFLRQFPKSQQEDIEVRLCLDQDATDEFIAVDQLQLFVQ